MQKLNEPGYLWLRALCLCIVYFILGRAGYFFVFHPEPASLLWLPSGFTLAVLIRSRFQNWPIYLFAIFVAEAAISLSQNIPWQVSLSWGLADTLEPLLAALIIRKFAGSPFSLMRLKDLTIFVFSVLTTPVFGAAIAAWASTRWLGGSSYWETMRTWWFAIALGEIVVAPFVLAWFGRRAHPYRGIRFVEEVLLILVVAAVTHITFSAETAMLPTFRFYSVVIYLIFPIFLWAVFRFEERGTSVTILLVNLIAAYHTASGRGPFAFPMASPEERLIALQSYLTLMNLSSLVLLASIVDRRRIQEQLKAIIENSLTIVFVKDLKGRYFMNNSRFEELLQLSPEEIVGKTDYDLFPKAYADLYRSHDRKVLEERRPMEWEESTPTPGGERIYISVKFPLFDAAGEPYGVCGFSTDITALKHAEIQLQNAEARSRLLADVSRAFGEARLELNVIFDTVAREVAEFFQDGSIVRTLTDDGCKLQTVAFHHVDANGLRLMQEILPDAHDFIDAEAMQEIIKTGKPVRVNGSLDQIRSRIREEYWPVLEHFPIHSWMIVPLRVAGKLTGTISVLRHRSAPAYSIEEEECLQNIAGRAALAIDNAQLYLNAQRAIQLREDFISVASHELRTPLTPLKLQMSLLKRHLLDVAPQMPRGDKLVQVLQNSDRDVDRLILLVENLLDTSRITKGLLSLNCARCDLSEITVSAIRRYQKALTDAGCELKVHIQPDVGGFWDPLRIDQVVVNLLTNAMKYARGKPIEIEISKKNEVARFSIRDHGIGIQKKDHEKIFERFERAMPLTSYGGLGLGLFITRQIVDAHLGKVWVESTVGEGSLFVMELPMEYLLTQDSVRYPIHPLLADSAKAETTSVPTLH